LATFVQPQIQLSYPLKTDHQRARLSDRAHPNYNGFSELGPRLAALTSIEVVRYPR
jgi:hypothetical protein